jgi:hypothetical protein
MHNELRITQALRRYVAGRGTQRAAAKELGMSQAYLCDLLHGRRRASDALLATLGLRRREVVERAR